MRISKGKISSSSISATNNLVQENLAEKICYQISRLSILGANIWGELGNQCSYADHDMPF